MITIHRLAAAILVCWLVPGVGAQQKTDEQERGLLKPGLATFHIGNSLTNTTARFADFVRTAGITHQYQSFTAGGALTWQLWDLQLPKRQKEWDTKLAGFKRIDHFT